MWDDFEDESGGGFWITNSEFTFASPMIAFWDSRCAFFNEQAKKELRDAGIGNYIHEIKDVYFTLVVNFEQPGTFVEAFVNWLKDHPFARIIHMPLEAKCPIKTEADWIQFIYIEDIKTHNLKDLLLPFIPSHIKVIFYLEETIPP